MTTKTIKVIFVLLSILCIFNNITSQSTCETATVVENNSTNIANISDNPHHWFKYTAEKDGKLTVSNCGSTSQDTHVAIYKECGGSLIASNDDGCSNQSKLSVTTDEGEVYFILWKLLSFSTGTSFEWTLMEEEAALGELRSKAIESKFKDNLVTTNDNKAFWYKITPTKSCRITINQAGDDSYYKYLYVYKSENQNYLNSYSGSSINASFIAEAGLTYYLKWSSHNNSTFIFNYSEIDINEGEYCVRPIKINTSGSEQSANITSNGVWYEYTPEKDCEINVTTSNNNNYKYLTLHNDCNGNSFYYRNRSDNFNERIFVTKGEKVLFHWTSYNESVLNWKLTELDTPDGKICQKPKVASSVNTTSLIDAVTWYKYVPTKNCLLNFMSDETSDHKTIYVYKSCKGDILTSFNGSGFNKSLIVNKGEHLLIKCQSEKDFEWKLNEIDFTPGDKCDLAVDLPDANNEITTNFSSHGNFWYKFTADKDSKITFDPISTETAYFEIKTSCSSSSYKDRFYSNSSDKTILLDKGVSIFINISVSNLDNYKWKYSIEDKFKKGESCEVPVVAELSPKLNSNSSNYYKKNWFKYEASKDCKVRIKTNENVLNNGYFHVRKSCDLQPILNKYINYGEKLKYEFCAEKDKSYYISFNYYSTLKPFEWILEELELADGDSQNSSVELVTENSTITTIPTSFRHYWYRYEAKDDCKLVLKSLHSSEYDVIGFAAYKGKNEIVKTFNLSSRKDEFIPVNKGEIVYLKISGSSGTSKKWQFRTEDLFSAGESCDFPKVVTSSATTFNSLYNKNWFKYTSTKNGILKISSPLLNSSVLLKVYKKCGGQVIFSKWFSNESINYAVNTEKGEDYFVELEDGYGSMPVFTLTIENREFSDGDRCDSPILLNKQYPEGLTTAINELGDKWYEYTVEKDSYLYIHSENGNYKYLKLYKNCDELLHSMNGSEIRKKITVKKGDKFIIHWKSKAGSSFNWTIDESVPDDSEFAFGAIEAVTLPKYNNTKFGINETRYYTFKSVKAGNLVVTSYSNDTRIEIFRQGGNYSFKSIYRTGSREFFVNKNEEFVFICKGKKGVELNFAITYKEINNASLPINAISAKVLPEKNIIKSDNSGVKWYKYKISNTGKFNIKVDTDNSNSVVEVYRNSTTNKVHNNILGETNNFKFELDDIIYIKTQASTDDLTFTISEDEVEKGDMCINAIDVVSGSEINTSIKRDAIRWFRYLPTKKQLINIKGNSSNHIYFKYMVNNCSDINFNSSQSSFSNIIDVDKDDEVFIAIKANSYNDSNIKWNIDTLTYQNGSKCNNPIEISENETINSDFTLGNEYWYTYNVKQSGCLNIRSLNNINMSLYIYNDCKDYNPKRYFKKTITKSVKSGDNILIKARNSYNNNYLWEIKEIPFGSSSEIYTDTINRLEYYIDTVKFNEKRYYYYKPSSNTAKIYFRRSNDQFQGSKPEMIFHKGHINGEIVTSFDNYSEYKSFDYKDSLPLIVEVIGKSIPNNPFYIQISDVEINQGSYGVFMQETKFLPELNTAFKYDHYNQKNKYSLPDNEAYVLHIKSEDTVNSKHITINSTIKSNGLSLSSNKIDLKIPFEKSNNNMIEWRINDDTPVNWSAEILPFDESMNLYNAKIAKLHPEINSTDFSNSSIIWYKFIPEADSLISVKADYSIKFSSSYNPYHYSSYYSQFADNELYINTYKGQPIYIKVISQGTKKADWTISYCDPKDVESTEFKPETLGESGSVESIYTKYRNKYYVIQTNKPSKLNIKHKSGDFNRFYVSKLSDKYDHVYSEYKKQFDRDFILESPDKYLLRWSMDSDTLKWTYEIKDLEIGDAKSTAQKVVELPDTNKVTLKPEIEHWYYYTSENSQKLKIAAKTDNSISFDYFFNGYDQYGYGNNSGSISTYSDNNLFLKGNDTIYFRLWSYSGTSKVNFTVETVDFPEYDETNFVKILPEKNNTKSRILYYSADKSAMLRLRLYDKYNSNKEFRVNRLINGKVSQAIFNYKHSSNNYNRPYYDVIYSAGDTLLFVNDLLENQDYEWTVENIIDSDENSSLKIAYGEPEINEVNKSTSGFNYFKYIPEKDGRIDVASFDNSYSQVRIADTYSWLDYANNTGLSNGTSTPFDVYKKTPVFFKWSAAKYDYQWTITPFDYKEGDNFNNPIEAVELPDTNFVYSEKREVFYTFKPKKSGYIKIKSSGHNIYKKIYIKSDGVYKSVDWDYSIKHIVKVIEGEELNIRWEKPEDGKFYWTIENYEFNEEFISLEFNKEYTVTHKESRYKFTADKDMLLKIESDNKDSDFNCSLRDSKDKLFRGYKNVFRIINNEEYRLYFSLSDSIKFIAKEYIDQSEEVCYTAKQITEGRYNIKLSQYSKKWFKLTANRSGLLNCYSAYSSIRYKKSCDELHLVSFSGNYYIEKGETVYLEIENYHKNENTDFTIEIEECSDEGLTIQNPKIAQLGENFKNLSQAQYFHYVAEESGMLEISSCNKTDIDTKLKVKIDKKSGGDVELNNGVLCGLQAGLRFYVDKGDEILITWSHQGQNYWTMSLDKEEQNSGYSCDNSISMIEGTNRTEDVAANLIWYKYTADKNCKISIDNFRNIYGSRLITGSCSGNLFVVSNVDDFGGLSAYIKEGESIWLETDIVHIDNMSQFDLNIQEIDEVEGLQMQYAEELLLGDVTTTFGNYEKYYYYFIPEEDGYLLVNKLDDFGIKLFEDFGNVVSKNDYSNNSYNLKAGNKYWLELTTIYGLSEVNWNVLFDSQNKAEIKSFRFYNCSSVSNINVSTKLVNVTVPHDTDLSNLRPMFSFTRECKVYIGDKETYSGNTYSDFTNDVVYKLVSANEKTVNNWTVKVKKKNSVSSDNLITKFEVYNQKSETIIDGNKIICKIHALKTSSSDQLKIRNIESSAFSVVKYKYDIINDGSSVRFSKENYIRCIAQNGDVNVYNLIFEADKLEGSDCEEPIIIDDSFSSFATYNKEVYIKFTGAESYLIKNKSDKPLSITYRSYCGSSDYGTTTIQPNKYFRAYSKNIFRFESDSYINFEIIKTSNNVNLGFSNFNFLNTSTVETKFKADSIKIVVPESTDVTELVATFGLNTYALVRINDDVQLSALNKNDFTTPLTYRLSKGEYNKDIVVKVSKYQKSSNAELLSYHISPAVDDPVISSGMFSINVANGTDLNSVTPTFEISENAKIYINDVEQVSGVNKVNLTNLVTYKVVAEDGTEKEWIIKVNSRELSKENDILTFKVEGQKGVSIDNDNKLITVELEDYVYSGAAMPEFTVSDKAEIRNSGIPQVSGVSVVDLSDTLRYEVSAENGDKIIWKVAAKGGTKVCGNDIIEFSFDEQKYPAIIDFENSAIKITVKKDTDISGLIPKFKLSQYAYAVLNGDNIVSDATEIDFTKSVTFIVYSYTGITRHWEVFVEVETNIDPQYKKELEIKLYPNPVSEFINLKFATNPGDNAKFELYNIYGKLLYSESIGKDKNEFKFNVEWLPESTYIAVVRIGDRVKSLKFIKK